MTALATTAKLAAFSFMMLSVGAFISIWGA